MLVQWTGSTRQQVTVPWTSLDSFVTLDAFANKVQTNPRLWRNFSTAIGEALAFSMAEFKTVSDCKRHLIDLSGDGVSNEGIEPASLRPKLRQAQIVVNAIAIVESEPDLTAIFL